MKALAESAASSWDPRRANRIWQVARAGLLLAGILIAAARTRGQRWPDALVGLAAAYLTLSLLTSSPGPHRRSPRWRPVGDLALAAVLVALGGPGLSSPLRYLLLVPLVEAALALSAETVFALTLGALVVATLLVTHDPRVGALGEQLPELLGLAALVLGAGLILGLLVRDAAHRTDRDRRLLRLLAYEQAVAALAALHRRPGDTTAVAHCVVDTAMALPGVQAATLSLLDDRAENLAPVVSRSRGPAAPQDQPWPVAPDELGGPGAPPPVTVARSLDLDGAVVLIPLVGADDHAIGRLSLSCALPPAAFGDAERESLASLGAQAGAAWETAWLRGRIREQGLSLDRSTGEITALLAVSQALVTVDRHEVLAQVLDRALALMTADRGSLMLLDEPAGTLHIETARGLPDDVIASTRVALGEGIAGRVALTGEPLRLLDAEAADAREGVRDALCVPLQVQGRVIGVLNVANRVGPGVFSERDLDLLAALANHAAVAILNARLLEDLQDLFLSTVGTLAKAVDAKDTYTAGHSHRVTLLAIEVAREMGFAQAEIDVLRIAALMHDVGKIGIPDPILRKPGPLNAAERELMREHPDHGARIVEPVKRLHGVLPGIRWHHERHDGQGYPDGLAGDGIPAQARALMVADAWDAMTSDRPYRASLPDEVALAELRAGRGTQWSPDAVDALLRAYDAGRIAPIRGWVPPDEEGMG